MSPAPFPSGSVSVYTTSTLFLLVVLMGWLLIYRDFVTGQASNVQTCEGRATGQAHYMEERSIRRDSLAAGIQSRGWAALIHGYCLPVVCFGSEWGFVVRRSSSAVGVGCNHHS
jgi:hypothetical protein